MASAIFPETEAVYSELAGLENNFPDRKADIGSAFFVFPISLQESRKDGTAMQVIFMKIMMGSRRIELGVDGSI